jgi:murein DD-endopeptidase MepM/ murein hydrolase activator NlpD
VGTAYFDKSVGRTPRGRALLVAALGLGLSLLGSQAAFGQSGGVGAPGDTTMTTTPATTTTPAPTAYPQVFPVPGPHAYGQGFGAPRSGHSHQGQDIFAACGSPLISVSRARVKSVSFHNAAGTYVVLRYKKLKQDYFYAHLATVMVAKKQLVLPGQQVGTVGDTGNARGCHLHFELWVGKWYRGGRPIDPLIHLQNWDSYS